MGGLNWILYSGSHKTELKALAMMDCYVDVLEKSLRAISFELLPEFSSLWLWDCGPYFLPGHQLRAALFLEAACIPLHVDLFIFEPTIPNLSVL